MLQMALSKSIEKVLSYFTYKIYINCIPNSILNGHFIRTFSSIETALTFQTNSKIPIIMAIPRPENKTRKTPPTLSIPSSGVSPASSSPSSQFPIRFSLYFFFKEKILCYCNDIEIWRQKSTQFMALYKSDQIKNDTLFCYSAYNAQAFIERGLAEQ